MPRGNGIIVTADPKGQFEEGFIYTGQTPKPGQILQREYTTALKGGRWTYKLYDRAADGDRPAGSLWILLPQLHRHVDVAYAAGEACQVYSPRAGEEYNLMLADVSGTGDDHLIGEIMIVDDSTGKLIATTGTPQTDSFVLQEAITDPVADQLVWVTYSGY